MKRFWILFFICGVVPWCRARTVVEVESRTKPVQRDGFLLEWSLEQARVIDTTFDLRADAVNTAEGLAGYIRYAAPESCWQWSFTAYPRVGTWKRFLSIHIDSAVHPGPFYSIDRVSTDTAVHVAVEWIIPWDTLSVDSFGRYEIGFVPSSQCGDTAEGFVVAGTYFENPYRGVWSPGLVAQVLVIAVLLVLYLLVRARAKKYSPRASRQGSV